MRELHVFISGQHVGVLMMNRDGYLGFAYDKDYVGPDLSVAIPSAEREVWGKRTHAWFLGVLPDNEDVRRGMAARVDCGTGDIMGLLSHYGMDLPGAVQVSPIPWLPAEEKEEEYLLLSESEIGERLRGMVEDERRNASRIWMQGAERWSLGGNQAKIALRRYDNAWYSCQGRAASNVIVKPGVSWLDSQALDECVSMRLAKLVGLPVANAELVNFGGFDAIAIDRYDRITSSSGEVVRIHQEDLCQALGVVPQKKYAADGGPSSAAVMDLLASDYTGFGRELFLDALVFNYLIAATDAHAKNYSLLHTRANKFRCAPLYDIASVAPYMEKGTVYRLAMSIGGENRVGWLRKSSLARFSRLHGLDQNQLADRVEDMAQRVKDNLEPAVNDFSSCAGIDELASGLVPRVRLICDAAQRNIRVDGTHFRPANPSRLVAGRS